MIKEKCDVCGKEFEDRYNLSELYKCYQSKEIKEVCQECSNEIRKTIAKVEAAMNPIKEHWVRQIINKIRGI